MLQAGSSLLTNPEKLIKMNSKGKVFLIGAGPGDPGLMTLKGLELIKQADVLVYDQLGTAPFIKERKSGCELIDVGKYAGHHKVPQHEINQILINKAREGNLVVRLKGGDPFVFGRGGEELQELKKAGIEFEVVPGITSAISAPAYAGIPVTHRDFTSTFAVITGHEADKENSAIDWQAVSRIGTLVFLMGVKKLPKIVANLLKQGRSGTTPVAMIQNGTQPIQRTVTGTLDTIVKIARENNIKAPAITIVGEVAQLKSELEWFEKRPLFGKKIVVTRSRHQASSLLKELQNLGAEAIEFPTIKIVQHGLTDEIKAFIDSLQAEYLVFTSVNGVNGFVDSLLTAGKDFRVLHDKKIVCIGPATAKAFQDKGIKPDFIPETYVAESLLPFFAGQPKGKVVFLRAMKARETLPQALRESGFAVDVIPVYHTEYDNPDSTRVAEMLQKQQIDLVTFTSSSTARGFYENLKNHVSDFSSVPAAVIGPITEETATELGFTIKCRADEYTIPGLVTAMLQYCSST